MTPGKAAFPVKPCDAAKRVSRWAMAEPAVLERVPWLQEVVIAAERSSLLVWALHLVLGCVSTRQGNRPSVVVVVVVEVSTA